MLKTLKRDRRNQPSQSNGSGTFSPSMLGGRNEADAWTPPPLPDLPQFREPDGDGPPLPPEPKKRTKTRSEKPKDLPPLGAMRPNEAAQPAQGKPDPARPMPPLPEPPMSLAPAKPAKPAKAAPPKEEARRPEHRSERRKLEIPPEPLDLGPADGDEPPIMEERPRQPTAATVGALLAQTRASFGQDIDEVSSALRIRPVFLRAIEESRYQDLPGLTYGVGFVRSYAHYLGLDVNDCVERFKDEAAGIDRTPNLNFPTPVPEAKVPTGAIILVSLLLAGLAYLVWTYVSRDGGFGETETATTETVTPAAAETATTTPASDSEASTATSSSGATTTTGATDGQTSDSGTTSAEDGAAGSAAAGVTGLAANAATPDATEAAAGDGSSTVSISNSAESAAGGAVSGGTGTVLFTEAASATQPSDPSVAGVTAAYSGPRVVLRATQDSWVQVRNSKGDSIFTRVLRAGDTYDVPEQSGLTLLTGNAGGLVITVDGQEVPKLGRDGQVRRNVSLNPDSLKAN